MPAAAKNDYAENDRARRLERDRLRRIKALNGLRLPESYGVDAKTVVPTRAAAHGMDGDEAAWSLHLERQRMLMMKAHGPWLPGPGAAAAAAEMPMEAPAASMEAEGESDEDAGAPGGKPQLPMMLKAATAFLPPGALKEFEKKGGKPVAEALWKIHEGLIAAVETIPFALLTLAAFHGWWYAANFKRTPGLPRLGIGDLFRILLYDGIILFIILLLIALITLLVVIVYAILNPLDFLEFIYGIA